MKKATSCAVIKKMGKEAQLQLDHLLQADSSVKHVASYLSDSIIYMLEVNGKAEGICVLLVYGEREGEIKNIAVAEHLRGQGHGKQLMKYVLAEAQRLRLQRVIVGTGNSSITQIAFYQKCGFDLIALQPDYFLDHYPERIWENGLLCKHLLIFEKQLKKAC